MRERERERLKTAVFKLAKPVLLVYLSAGNSEALAQPALRLPPAQLSISPGTERFRRSPSSGLWVHAWSLPLCILSPVPVVSGSPS